MALLTIDSVNIPSVTPPSKGYGLLYNGYTVIDPNFLPSNWQLPITGDFTPIMWNVLGAKSTRQYPTNNSGWVTPGTNTFKLEFLPNGYRLATGQFSGATTASYHYTRTVVLPAQQEYFTVFNATSFSSFKFPRNYGLGVRIKMIDISEWYEGDTVTDYDGNIYETCLFNGQVWITSNWKCTKLNNGTAIANVTDNALWQAATTPAYCTYNNVALIEE